MTDRSDRATRIHATLTRAFSPEMLTVTDDSSKHAGHAGAQPGGQTHYSVTIVSREFDGMGRVARHRAVNQALAAEFEAGLHALSVSARSMNET